ncbi:uncharacterized protein PgNI_08084, partial [Pyricularia grisea]|uniref:Uncharacterized protein n=1 Tax=Pyricularia grisea TaxID=148305 RepID=A0A6P8AW61_PYRGI
HGNPRLLGERDSSVLNEKQVCVGRVDAGLFLFCHVMHSKKAINMGRCKAVALWALRKGRNLAKCSTEYVQKTQLFGEYLGLRTELDDVLLMFHSHRWALGQLALNYFVHRITRAH